MNIIDKFMAVNPYSRPGIKRSATFGIILHYVGVNGHTASIVWNWFANDCPKTKHFSSTQYIVDHNGDIIRTMPDEELAYHCGSSQIDPASGRVYTDWARKRFGRYAENYKHNSPNNCTIGIELCIDRQGNFTPETINAAVELVAKLVKDNGLSVFDIGHHKMVVGWKDCPLPWVKNTALFDEFKNMVEKQMRVTA
jgi:N-acetylmuramoyl-L-alanine amidase